MHAQLVKEQQCHKKFGTCMLCLIVVVPCFVVLDQKGMGTVQCTVAPLNRRQQFVTVKSVVVASMRTLDVNIWTVLVHVICWLTATFCES